MRYFLLLLIPVLFSLSSCGVDPDDINKPTATRLDTLQGDWKTDYAVLTPRYPAGPPAVATNPGMLHLRSDFTGQTELNPFIAPYNFTYVLLPDDSTLIFNINPGGTPVYDTNIIRSLTTTSLFLTTARKQINSPYYGGVYEIWRYMTK